ncbi:MAG: DNA/RNA nuclease SfsA, partial [Synechococcus sp. BS30m-G31]|nr:DNA/RNA nuclease SfsA [Synechococcus sp. BS30m-G31]
RYGDLFRLAMAAGVEVLPCRFSFDEDRINWEGLQPVHPRQ